MNVEKWINELQIAVADLFRRVDAAASGAFKPTITDPAEGQAIIYNGTSWINGSAIPPAPEPPTEYALIEQIDDAYQIVNPMQYKEDGTTTFVKDNSGEYLKLKTGAGAFVSEARSINPVDITDMDVIKLVYTAIGETRTADIDISTYTGQWYLGVFYESTPSYFEVGAALYPVNTPQVLAVKIAALHDSAAAGNVFIYGYTAEKTPETNTRKKTTKKK